jgi:hypothetical protein
MNRVAPPGSQAVAGRPDPYLLGRSLFVHDPSDAGATGAVARDLGALERTVRVSLAPEERRPVGALGRAILEALGKDLDLTPALRQQDAWRLARAWLDAERVQTLIVIGAEQFTAELWQAIDDIRRYDDVRAVILISHLTGRPSHRGTPAPERSAFKSADAAALHAWARHAKAEHTAPHIARDDVGARFPAVPADEAPFFRSACRALLEAGDFRRVDRLYRRGYDSAQRWSGECHEVSEQEVGAFLAESVLGTNDTHEQLTRLRGTQIAFLHHHWLLKVDLEALSAAYLTDPPTTIDALLASRLRAYPQPRLSALAALSVATGFRPAQLAILNADQIFPGRERFRAACARIDYGDHEVPIAVEARPFLRGYRADRMLRGEPSEGPLFTTTNGQRLTAAQIQQLLRRVSQQTGLALVGAVPRHDDKHGHWMRRRGITIQRL